MTTMPRRQGLLQKRLLRHCRSYYFYVPEVGRSVAEKTFNTYVYLSNMYLHTICTYIPYVRTCHTYVRTYHTYVHT
jgi:hypothetical protein